MRWNSRLQSVNSHDTHSSPLVQNPFVPAFFILSSTAEKLCVGYEENIKKCVLVIYRIETYNNTLNQVKISHPSYRIIPSLPHHRMLLCSALFPSYIFLYIYRILSLWHHLHWAYSLLWSTSQFTQCMYILHVLLQKRRIGSKDYFLKISLARYMFWEYIQIIIRIYV